MIDSYLRSSYQHFLVDPILQKVKNTSPNTLTALGLILGMSVIPTLAFGFPLCALLLLLTSGYLDTLDGSLARISGKASPQGAVFDIISDRVVEFSAVLALFLVAPETRGLPCLLMLGSILLCITSFLVVGIFLKNDTEKSFHYSLGIMERSEAFLFFSLMIVFPALFAICAYLFCILVTLTAIVRIYQFTQRS